MRSNEVIKTRRQALGMTQATLGDLAGVTGSTVSAFEKGAEVSLPVYRSIRQAIDDVWNRLEGYDKDYAHLLQMTYALEYQTEEEKMKSLLYIAISANHMAINIDKRMKGF